MSNSELELFESFDERHPLNITNSTTKLERERERERERETVLEHSVDESGVTKLDSTPHVDRVRSLQEE